tara:strand:- start:551 stop:1321 length:771 start_codon:yes stop_codon:yes gene_type:complete
MKDKQLDLESDIFKMAGDPMSSAIDAACILGRHLDENFDTGYCRSEIAKITKACPQTMEPWVFLKQIGFSGMGGIADTIAGSRLDIVLQKKEGLPISLGILLLEICKERGHFVQGINFPGHFLVRIDQRLIDPVSMEETTEENCLDSIDSRLRKNAFKEADATAIFLRMLNNIKYYYATHDLWELAIRAVNAQLVIQPNNEILLVEQGDFWCEIGAISAARECFIGVLELVGQQESDIQQLVLSRLANLPPGPRLH